MTSYTNPADNLGSWEQAIKAMRHIRLLDGSLPVESDEIDLMTLWAIARGFK